MASNENPIGPSKKSISAIQDYLNLINRYPDSSGYLLRKKLSQKFNLKLENVILGAGSEGVMSSIMRTFLQSGDEIIGTESSKGKKIDYIIEKLPKKKLLLNLQLFGRQSNHWGQQRPRLLFQILYLHL